MAKAKPKTLAEMMQELPVKTGISKWEELTEDQRAQVDEMAVVYWSTPPHLRKSKRAITRMISDSFGVRLGRTTLDRWLEERRG